MINTHITEDTPRRLRAVKKPSTEGYNLRYAWVTVFSVLVVVIISDLFSHGHHGGVFWESIPLFFLACGVLSCLILILAAKLFGLLWGRSEDDDE